MAMRMTNPYRVMFPDAGLTKLEVARYYHDVGKWLLPHVTERAVSLVRCPDGCDGAKFFQKHAPTGLDESVRRVDLGHEKPLLAVDRIQGVLAFVQFGAVELHSWNSRIDLPERPDRVVFDLDPGPDVTWKTLAGSAFELRALIEDLLGMRCFVKTTGGKGLHVVVPLARRHDWDLVKRFAKRVSEIMVKTFPAKLTISPSKSFRRSRIYLDHHRNARGATAVAPYSIRATGSAPVSTPVAWDELASLGRSDRFTVADMASRLTNLSVDPWADLSTCRPTISAAVRSSLGMA